MEESIAIFVHWMFQSCILAAPSHAVPVAVTFAVADPCQAFNDASTVVNAACITKMWTDAGCTKVDSAAMPGYYWLHDHWRKATKAAIANDMKLWATSTSPDRVAACQNSENMLTVS